MSIDHEYASLEKVKNHNIIKALLSIPYLKEIINLSSQIKFITFFAEWCPNCEYEAIELKKYYDSHHMDIDFSMIMLFSSKEKSKRFINNYQLNINDYYGNINSKDEELNIKSTYYKFRNTLGDERKWGVPLHIIMKPVKPLNEIFVVKGESIRDEINKLLNDIIKA